MSWSALHLQRRHFLEQELDHEVYYMTYVSDTSTLDKSAADYQSIIFDPANKDKIIHHTGKKENA